MDKPSVIGSWQCPYCHLEFDAHEAASKELERYKSLSEKRKQVIIGVRAAITEAGFHKPGCVQPSIEDYVRDIINSHASLVAQRDRLLEAAREILLHGVEFDDERLGYVIAHVDKDAISELRAAIQSVEQRK